VIAYPHIDPIILSVGPVQLHWYGLMYVLGFCGAWVLGRAACKRPDAVWTEDQLADLIFFGALGVVLGGRLGYVFFYNLPQFLQDPLWLLRIDQGGMSFHGGLLGVLVSTGLYARRQGKSFFQMTDFIAPLVPFGLGAGRIGNFIGGELWGRASDVPWAMVFPGDPLQLPRHPSQLYQFFAEGVVLFAAVWLFSRRQRPEMAVSGFFLVTYGLLRTVVELFRQPDPQLGYLIGGLTMGQLLSLPMVLVGLVMLVRSYTRPAVNHSFSRSRTQGPN